MHTEDDRYLLVRLLEGEGGAELGVDDNGAMDGGAVVVAVRVPPERALFLRKDDGVGEVSAGLDGTLGLYTPARRTTGSVVGPRRACDTWHLNVRGPQKEKEN